MTNQDDALASLEDWKDAAKCRSVTIEIDDGYGATCWRVELRHGRRRVVCSETTFFAHPGIDPLWHEAGDTLHCCVVAGDSLDDWPGLAATIRRAIECADKFFGADPKH